MKRVVDVKSTTLLCMQKDRLTNGRKQPFSEKQYFGED